MADFDPVDPVAYAWWVPALGLILLLLAIAWVVYLLRTPRGRTRSATPERSVPQLRSSFGERLESVYAAFQRGEVTLRDLHLQVAEIVREFGSGRVGRDLTAMSRGEVVAFMPGSRLGELLSRCEQPSFSRDPAAEAEHTVGIAREVITRW